MGESLVSLAVAVVINAEVFMAMSSTGSLS